MSTIITAVFLRQVMTGHSGDECVVDPNDDNPAWRPRNSTSGILDNDHSLLVVSGPAPTVNTTYEALQDKRRVEVKDQNRYAEYTLNNDRIIGHIEGILSVREDDPVTYSYIYLVHESKCIAGTSLTPSIAYPGSNEKMGYRIRMTFEVFQA